MVIMKKNALVLSSSRGLGLGIAEALADEGANVLLTGRSEDRLKENVARINKKGQGEVPLTYNSVPPAPFRRDLCHQQASTYIAAAMKQPTAACGLSPSGISIILDLWSSS